jgi:thiosulfate/3-mercaptopyruvate sulfurtransferase
LSPLPRDSEVLVDPDWIEAHLGEPSVRLIEVDVSAAAYEAGHIPGAVLWNAYGDLRDPAYLPVERAELGRLLSLAGVQPDTTLVFYGYGAALGFWLMKAQGHGDVRVLEGDREQWPASAREWSTEVPAPAIGSYRLAAEDERIQASQARVEAAIDDPAQVLVDVRSELEFSGERFWPSGASADVGRAGHVPGAISVPIDLLREESGSLRDAEELRRVFEAKDIGPDKTVIVYCTIANRASQAWFGLTQLLGYPDVQVYYGSWVEWGKRDDTPIETA